MQLLAAALLLTSTNVDVDNPTSYLASLSLPLTDQERSSGFTVQTWGVAFVSVCSIPPGWRIKEGGRTNPGGELSGEASNGVTWLSGKEASLRKMVLLKLYGAVQKRTIRVSASGQVPATFHGSMTVQTGDREFRREMSWRNLRLAPATHCPAR